MQFEVNGQMYFLKFAEEDGGWYLLTRTERGIAALEIENDVGRPSKFVMLSTEDGTSKTIN